MAEKFTKFLGQAMRGRVFPIALAAATSFGAGMLYMKNRQEAVDENKSDVPDSKTLLQKSLEMKDAAISASKELFQNPEKKD